MAAKSGSEAEVTASGTQGNGERGEGGEGDEGGEGGEGDEANQRWSINVVGLSTTGGRHPNLSIRGLDNRHMDFFDYSTETFALVRARVRVRVRVRLRWAFLEYGFQTFAPVRRL